MMLQQLDFLLSCCKGLQSPAEEEYKSTDEKIQQYQRTVASRVRVLASDGMAVELARSMEQAIQGAVIVWPHEHEIIEKVCQIIRSMMTASQFSPMYLPFPILIGVIGTGFQQHAFPCWLDAAAKIVSVYYFETTGGSLTSKFGSNTVPDSTVGAGTSSAPHVLDLESQTTTTSIAARGRSAAELENEAAFTRLLSTLVARTIDGIQSMAGMYPCRMQNAFIYMHVWGDSPAFYSLMQCLLHT